MHAVIVLMHQVVRVVCEAPVLRVCCFVHIVPQPLVNHVCQAIVSVTILVGRALAQ